MEWELLADMDGVLFIGASISTKVGESNMETDG